MNSKRARSPFILGLVLALLLTGCAAPAPARTREEDVWVQDGWIQQNTLASQGGTIYAYLGDEGALYAFDREAGTKSLALQMLYYLTEQNGLLYAGGVGGSGGFA